MELITVIVPVFRVENYLQRCVDSILVQTFMDFRLVLIDDGSPDNCGAICDEYVVKDARVHVIHQENGGLSAARNAGIDWALTNTASEWITFVDSDDWIHPRMLEELYHAVQSYDVKVSICGYQETDSNIPWQNERSVEAVRCPVEQFYVEHNVNATVAWGKLYHRDCFRQIRYPIGKIHEDEYVTYRILFEHEQVAVVDAPLYAYFVNPQGITKSKWTVKRLSALVAYKEQLCFFEKNGYQKAYQAQAVRYIRKLCLSISEIRSNDNREVTRSMLYGLKKEMLFALIKHRKDTIFDQKNLWIYESTFPRIMKAYWTYRTVKDKLLRFNQ